MTPFVSIHAPREGSDVASLTIGQYDRFQSTPPARGATRLDQADAMIKTVSIHAPREGSDPKSTRTYCQGMMFQSTPPARGATLGLGDAGIPMEFQSTPPARGATRRLG